MLKITYTNRLNQSVEIGSGTSFRILKMEGFEGVDAELQSQKSPYQDGSTFIDAELKERFPVLEIKIIGEDPVDLLRKRTMISSVLNPKLGEGILRYTDIERVLDISAVPLGVPTFQREHAESTTLKCLIRWTCHNPYWKSSQITEEPTFESLFEFPFEGEFEMGIQRDQRTIINDGDSAAPIQVEFYGPAVNPIITNKTTGEYIKVNRTLAEGEYMRIDTTRGKKSVEFISPEGLATNVFNWIDLGSSFFQLVIGENEIEYSADSDIQGAIVNISYNKLYNAV
jgi:hypothetical protein